MKNIINLVIEEELHKKRIDTVIAQKNDTLSRTRIKNLILNGNLCINDKIVNDPSKKIYKDDKQSKTFVYNILELFLIKDISVSNSDVYNYFLKRINDFKKFNLDDESLFLEINSKLLNG